MKWQVNINGNKDFKVENTGKEGELVIDEQAQLFDFVTMGKRHFTVLANNQTIEVFVLKYDAAAKTGTFLVNGKKCTLSATDEMDLLLRKLGMDSGGVRKIKELKAPMPGLVVKIEVEAGAEVKKDQSLVILEAMKMENVLKAQADGIVQSIEVKKGQAVEKNQVLIKFG